MAPPPVEHDEHLSGLAAEPLPQIPQKRPMLERVIIYWISLYSGMRLDKMNAIFSLASRKKGGRRWRKVK